MLPGFVYLREKLSGGNLSHIMTGDADTGKGGVDNAALRDIVEAYNCHLLRHLVASEPQGLDSSDCNQVIVRKITSGIFSKKAIFKAAPFLLHFATVFHQRSLLNFAG